MRSCSLELRASTSDVPGQRSIGQTWQCKPCMQEFPAIRFRAAKPTGDDPALEARALVAQRVAIEIHDRLIALQKAGVVSDTCDASSGRL
jgi:hypothetical protein